MTARLDDLIAPLTDAAMQVLPPVAEATDLRERLRDALYAALRAAPRPGVAPDRLEPAVLREDASALLKRSSSPDALVAAVAGLLREIREADQRAAWIQRGYSADARKAWDRADAAEQEAAELRHALRLVKRATRDVRVGRE